MIILLMGAPGSGKGTQAKRLETAHHLPHISTGDLFRKNVSENTPLGQKVKAVLAAGQFVDDQLVLDMLFDRLAESDCSEGYILDGVPRTLPQAAALEQHLNNQTMHVINIEVPDEVIVERASGRRVCQECQQVFNISQGSLSQNPSICPNCSGNLIQRSDDRPEVVQERLTIYRNQTLPVIDYYQKKRWLMIVDGTRSPDEVFKTIELLLS
jgi:adenylate kinase